VVKAGRRQVFAEAKLFAIQDDISTLVATATAVMVPIDAKLESTTK
jgi:acyl-coenzyme A thioesterase PaaI-like protein